MFWLKNKKVIFLLQVLVSGYQVLLIFFIVDMEIFVKGFFYKIDMKLSPGWPHLFMINVNVMDLLPV